MTTGRTWPKYKVAGVHELLNKAAVILDERPFIKGTIRHKETGAVDTLGSLALASGVRYDSLTDNLCEMGIPRNNVATLFAAVDVMEAYFGSDLGAWTDRPETTKEDAMQAFTIVADEIGNTI